MAPNGTVTLSRAKAAVSIQDHVPVGSCRSAGTQTGSGDRRIVMGGLCRRRSCRQGDPDLGQQGLGLVAVTDSSPRGRGRSGAGRHGPA